jgi:uncharacterized Zn-binding protein involved in type VI secretion
VKPAARALDPHTCPLPAHVGGPVGVPGQATVAIEHRLAARAGDPCACVGAEDRIAAGSATVYAEHQALARAGDPTAHGGVVVGGSPTVIVGG